MLSYAYKKRGEKMKRMEKREYKSSKNLSGRIFIRVDNQTKRELENSAKALKTTCSDIVRRGIKLVYSSL